METHYLTEFDAAYAFAGIIVIGWLIFGCVALVIDNIRNR